jgi:myotubularin-related protein 5/13
LQKTKIAKISVNSLGLNRLSDSGDGFRMTVVNVQYKCALTYPAVLAVPESTSDDNVKRLARLYRHGRFPSITWRHEDNGALLLRGASFQSKNAVVGLFRGHHHNLVSAAYHFNTYALV